MQVTDEWHLAEGGSTLNMQSSILYVSSYFPMQLDICILNYVSWQQPKKVECVKYTIYIAMLLAEFKRIFQVSGPHEHMFKMLQSIKHSSPVFPALWDTEQADSVLHFIHLVWCQGIPSLPLSSGMFSIHCSDLNEGTTW